MSAKKRVRRPHLERTQPIRNWSTLFETPHPDGGQAGATPEPAARGENVSLSDIVSRSVDVGYRVVDEYVRRGQRVAQRISERSYDAQAMTSDVQDLAARTIGYASDLAAVWVELVQRAATDSARLAPQDDPPAEGGSAPAATTSGAPAPPHDAPVSAGAERAPARVKIEVVSAQPVEVTLDLRPEATGLRLITHALRAVDPDKPRMSDVGFRAAAHGAPSSLWIRVPPGQPPGVYNTVIVDEQSSRPVGTLSVRVLPAS